MPRAFTEEEKKQIPGDLTRSGIDLFGRFGFEKTSIDMVVRDCGVAKGSFYKFFGSKELFFLHCLGETEKEVDRQEIEILLSRESDPAALIRELIALTFSITDRFPIIRAWFSLSSKEKILRALSPEQQKELFDTDNRRMTRVIEVIRRTRPDFSLTPGEMTSLFRSLFFMNEYREMISDDFDRFAAAYGDILTRGLLK